MQRDFCEIRGGYLSETCRRAGIGDEVVQRLRAPIGPIARVLDRARSAGMPVVYTVEAHQPDLSDIPESKRDGMERIGTPIGSDSPLGRVMVWGEPGSEIVEELAPRPDELVVPKPGKGAFYATDLDDQLRDRGVTHLVIVGITTDCCVFTTRMEARDRGYHTMQLHDCCAATRNEAHEVVCDAMRAHPEAFGLISRSDAFCTALDGLLSSQPA